MGQNTISFDEKEKIFLLSTEDTSYMMGFSPEGFLGHIYYGKKVNHVGGQRLLHGAVNNEVWRYRDGITYRSIFPYEYPTGGVGDFRNSCLEIENESGQNTCELVYESHRIFEGVPELPGLPHAFRGKDMINTLEITLADKVLDIKVQLFYSVFEKENVITRSARITNCGKEKLIITRAMSASFDMDDRDYEMLSLHGSWGSERRIQRKKLAFGSQMVSSKRGVTSHMHSPFMAVVSSGADQDMGDVYGMSLVYSGNFQAEVYKEMIGNIRMITGINPDTFKWHLEPGATFVTPEADLTFSAEGIGKMTRNYHDFYRNHIIRSPYKEKERPVLLNNWEATYMDFDADKLYAIAKKASECGVEMFVMDDGWFGKRDSDNSGLGDWIVNEKKLGCSLKELVDKVKNLGMKFGIWFEPEMISEDSDLYRAHPDYAIRVKGRKGTLGREQMVLDYSRKEVRDTIYKMMYDVIKNAGIDYVKWDMNRYLTDLGSAELPADRQGELSHRFMLGVYELQDRLITDFPELLLENCSSGGGRFDAGMIYYSPQIWCSDDTDAIERLHIQEGTALFLPMSTMGAHISKCPNEQVGRNTPIETRCNVALAGTFGYELNIDELSEEEKSAVPRHIERYKKYHGLVSNGDYYRLNSWNDKKSFDMWENVSKDSKEALVTYIQVLCHPGVEGSRVMLKGLDPHARYELEEVTGHSSYKKGQFFWGDELMNIGLWIPQLRDFESCLYHFIKSE